MSGAYTDLDPGGQANMTVLNCVVPVMLTNHFLPTMLSRGWPSISMEYPSK